MRSKSLALKVIAVAFILCVAATAIDGWQERSKAESWPAGGGGVSSFVPTSTPALW